MDPIEIALDVELQQDRRTISWPARHRGLDTVEPKLVKIEFIHKDFNHTNWIFFADPHRARLDGLRSSEEPRAN